MCCPLTNNHTEGVCPKPAPGPCARRGRLSGGIHTVVSSQAIQTLAACLARARRRFNTSSHHRQDHGAQYSTADIRQQGCNASNAASPRVYSHVSAMYHSRWPPPAGSAQLPVQPQALPDSGHAQTAGKAGIGRACSSRCTWAKVFRSPPTTPQSDQTGVLSSG